MVQKRQRWQRTYSKLVLLVLLGGLLAGLTAGTLGQAQSTAPWPPEVQQWARQVVEQLSVGIRETVFALPAADLGEIQQRAQRVLNVLVGKQSPDYQTKAGDPLGADGIGVQAYLERLRNAIEPRAQSNDRLRPALFALNILQAYHREALDHIKEILRVNEEGPARRNLNQLLAFLVAARGSSEDPLSEGGARALLIYLGGK
ncbi:MAG: hypothetical protein A2Z21_05695 [Candidatus Fraserbacteria bacterium RBG_16_55_9]|uniref:Uncharacterized protein n=1 Tax=Fraserbacteria sp. (strain RBG_16_55_9) TaxID=1817864 RepID=A0A1F5UPK9_FRAXR|nr:MAG: hypothetical protein A2Z21_05695 [Candidatus Fraserbacteria bacterium RBG_16_55_9]